MKERKGSLPGIKNFNTKPKSLESIKNIDITRSKSFLPVMKNFGQVQPSLRIIKRDGSYGQVKDFNMPEIKKLIRPIFNGNFRTKPYEITVNDHDAQAFLDEVVAQGGLLTNEVADAYNAFVLREKAANRYSKIKRLYPYLGGVINSARIDAISLAQATNFNFVNADTDAICGLKGDGSTKRLDVALASNIWSDANNWQLYHYEIIAETGDRQVMGAISGGNDMVAIRRRNVSTGVSYIYGNNVAIVAQISGGYASQQSVFGGRFSSADLTIYQDAATVTNTTTNIFALPVIYPISLFARNGVSIQYSNAKVGCDMMAQGMTKAEMTAFDASYKTFLTNIGVI